MQTAAQIQASLQAASTHIAAAEAVLAEVWGLSEKAGYLNESKQPLQTAREEVAYLQRLAPNLV